MNCRKEAELQDLENSQPVHIVKNEKACWEENTKGIARLSLDKRDSRVIRTEALPAWAEGDWGQRTWRKVAGLLTSHRTGQSSYSVHVRHPSKQGKNDPKGTSEIIRAATVNHRPRGQGWTFLLGLGGPGCSLAASGVSLQRAQG